jgi:hypothetical protein
MRLLFGVAPLSGTLPSDFLVLAATSRRWPLAVSKTPLSLSEHIVRAMVRQAEG